MRIFFSSKCEYLTSVWCIVASAQGRTMGYSSESLSDAETHKENEDFGDGANPLWSLFSKQAKTQDEARFQKLGGGHGWRPSIRACITAYTNSIEFINVYFHRLACFLQFLLPSSSKVFRHYNRIRHSNRCITSNSRWRCSAKFRGKSHSSPRRFPFYLLHLPI